MSRASGSAQETQENRMNELIRELVEALRSLDGCYCEAGLSLSHGERAAHRAALISARSTLAKARAYLETGGWTKVEDGLPVVPDGLDHVEIFFFCEQDCERRVGRRLWIDVDAVLSHGITHWRYAESTPEPPKG